MYSSFIWPMVRFTAKRLKTIEEVSELADRQDRIAGFDTNLFHRKRVLCVGAGGLGGPVAWGLAKKGVGYLHVMDDDVVEIPDLTRQFFTVHDLYQPKAFRLAFHAAEDSAFGTHCIGHRVRFDEESAKDFETVADAVVVLVDNNQTRRVAALFGRQHNVPVIFSALDQTGDFAWAFVQSPTGPCLGCIFPRVIEASSQKRECQPVPAILDSCFSAASMVLRAVDSVLLGRGQWWNYKSTHLAGGPPDITDTVKPRPGCRLCQESEQLAS
jgi:molybdopterin/thiamine biosynthesis adenylyltransferase